MSKTTRRQAAIEAFGASLFGAATLRSQGWAKRGKNYLKQWITPQGIVRAYLQAAKDGSYVWDVKLHTTLHRGPFADFRERLLAQGTAPNATKAAHQATVAATSSPLRDSYLNDLDRAFQRFGARQKGVGRWTVEDERKWGGTISWHSPRVMRGREAVTYTIELDDYDNVFLVSRGHVFLGESESLGEAKAKAKRDLNYNNPEFGFDDAQQWAYDKAHGGTRWGPRSMGGGYGTFGGADKEAFFNMGQMAYRATGKKVATLGDLDRALQRAGLDGGSWQERAFKDGFMYANAHANDDWVETVSIEDSYDFVPSAFGQRLA